VAEGLSAGAAAKKAMAMPPAEANLRIPANVPVWQRHGVLAGYAIVPRIGRDPRTGKEMPTTRRVVRATEISRYADIRPLLMAVLSQG
jgi:hypothetical protein